MADTVTNSSNLLTLQDLYNESLVRELLEKTVSCGLTWSSLGSSQYQASQIDTNVDPVITWDFFITKTQIGSLTYIYTLDVKKDAVSFISISSNSPLLYSNRDEFTKQLYDTVETLVLQLDLKLKEALNLVQSLTDCRS